MHDVNIRPHIVDRVMARRGHVHWFDRIDPARTALIVIDMQSLFCEAGAPGEVPGSRAIVPGINQLTRCLRPMGVPIVWVLHANARIGDRSDWEMFFNHIVAKDVKARTIESLTPGRQTVWPELETAPGDLTIFKTRYSALIPGSSSLERTMRSLGIDTLLIAGTKTNVCCESTARDGMMLDFNVVMVSDCCAALSDEEHQSSLETIIQQFGDVLTGAEVLEHMR
ncbi:Isochorismatase family protein YecD [Pandoraea terrae]|uniref:Isochorismatase family protein YecD n=1 Tax=Pandoraea terrae TaxID=1537710 RepID=A0A5E4TPF3_9BURK|nr:cysteine hydrolase [Pandoraea terrae]VVD89687.1 Isochorismatase family protein YecD [Pandoraea terrae]